MAKSIRDNKKKRGRPKTTGTGILIGVRMLDPELSALDAWARSQDDAPSRPEVIRRLLKTVLANRTGVPTSPHSKKKTAAKASDMAGSAIDQLGDKSAPPDEQAKRKRRLLKGPSEFREMRDDLPKRKR